MQEFTFLALGTTWSVVVDDTVFSDQAKQSILDLVQGFEKRFSRFLPDSEVNAFRTATAGDYPLSHEFLRLLVVADRLRVLTLGAYDPAVAGLLEEAGYGAQSGLDVLETKKSLPQWSLHSERLTIDGPVAFDFGGMGKGYCIDRVADILKSFGYDYFVVEGGGDMVATCKKDGSPWRVAVEYPGKPDLAASLVELSHQGLAVSDSFRRRFGKWHHLISAQERVPIEHIIGCTAVARDAWAADSMTSGLFFGPTESYPVLAEEFSAEYLVFQKDGTVTVSGKWPGELF